MSPSHPRHGFTLVELMVVVVVLGVLASTAVVASVSKIRKARSVEAASNLSKIYQGEITYLPVSQERGYASFVNAPALPSEAPGAARYVPNVARWAASTEWAAIGFSLDAPHYFQYAAPADEISFSARALGDLDGDGVQSTFQRIGRIVVPGEVQNFGLSVTNELE